MTTPVARGDPQFRERAEQIERLTARVQAIADDGARAPALELVQAVLQLHADCLERLVEKIECDEEGADRLARAAEDPLVAGLLLLYGLHPEPLESRVARALDKVRPYLESHGGNVELVEITAGIVRLRLTGSCRSCPSSTDTLRQAVEQAILELAPDVAHIVADSAPAELPPSQLVQIA